MAPRTCIVCGALCKGSRCNVHRTRSDSRASGQLDRRHKAITAVVISKWVAEHGWVCPGWQRPEHEVPVGYLTGDHIIPRALRPDLAHEISNYGVLCQVCNSKKGMHSGKG